MTGRRIALYFAWDRVAEEAPALGDLNDRYPALFELRRAIWPTAEGLAELPEQGIAGFLSTIVLGDFDRFRSIARDVSGHTVALLERRDCDGAGTPLAEWLSEVDTLILICLDHLSTLQAASDDELAALRQFLARADTMMFVCPHHDIGTTPDPEAELAHHGDRLVPAHQRIGGFARSVLGGLGLDVDHKHGFRPARAPDGQPAALRIEEPFQDHPLLAGVSTFNLHPHLPDLQVGQAALDKVDIIARQKVADDAPVHPALRAGEAWFNAMVETRPEAGLGRIVICDATLWSSAFGGEKSLTAFWHNVAQYRDA